MEVALETLEYEFSKVGLSYTIANFKNLARLSDSLDFLILIGHSQSEGMLIENGIMSWSNLYSQVSEKSRNAIVLACHSPTNSELGILGFSGQIDARAGALLTAWQVQHMIEPEITSTVLLTEFSRVGNSYGKP
ncbi:MAG: hypothetical protein P1Q69_16250 [Candidatus Thorarchaeota archaeon]|nr:hypothetical protein [Candidatus Thorarchaeota archaeon]